MVFTKSRTSGGVIHARMFLQNYRRGRENHVTNSSDHVLTGKRRYTYFIFTYRRAQLRIPPARPESGRLCFAAVLRTCRCWILSKFRRPFSGGTQPSHPHREIIKTRLRNECVSPFCEKNGPGWPPSRSFPRKPPRIHRDLHPARIISSTIPLAPPFRIPHRCCCPRSARRSFPSRRYTVKSSQQNRHDATHCARKVIN